MRKYRFFFVLLFVYSCCTSIVCAMRSIDCKSETDVVIDMDYFWSSDYKKNINDIKEIDLKNMRSRLKQELCLLPDATALDHLLYLSTIRKNNEKKTPFTQEQQDRFNSCFKTEQFVSYCFAINGVVIACAALLPFANLVGLSHCSNITQSECLSQVSSIMIPTVMASGGIFIEGFVSLCATGLLPDLSSRKANKVQDELAILSRNYATIAKYWIDIYFNSPEKAHYIVGQFDIEELKKRVKLKTYTTSVGNDLVNPLEEAWHFIKYNNILVTFTEIESYIYNKIHCREIVSLSRQIKLLGKIVHKKIQK